MRDGIIVVIGVRACAAWSIAAGGCAPCSGPDERLGPPDVVVVIDGPRASERGASTAAPEPRRAPEPTVIVLGGGASKPDVDTFDGSPPEVAIADAVGVVAAPDALADADAEAGPSAAEAASPTPETPAATANPTPAPSWLERFHEAYARQQIARSDLTTELSAADVGVYVVDLRAGADAAGTPNRVWLQGEDVQALSPELERMIVDRAVERVGYGPTFSCDPSRYVCRSLPGAPFGAYFRFAPIGPARTVFLVGVLYYDLDRPGAATDMAIAELDRVVDARLAEVGSF